MTSRENLFVESLDQRITYLEKLHASLLPEIPQRQQIRWSQHGSDGERGRNESGKGSDESDGEEHYQPDFSRQAYMVGKGGQFTLVVLGRPAD